ncbi:MAG: HVO_2753 family zinc finger protein [Halobacteriota archaeon]
MSEAETTGEQRCVSCGINVAGTNAARFNCPACGTRINRCAKCRKQSNPYECPECGFRGP